MLRAQMGRRRCLMSLRSNAALLTSLIFFSAHSAMLHANAASIEPFVEIFPVSTPGGAATRVKAVIEIEANPAAVWAVITDCARAPKVIPHLESCRIVEKGPSGSWDVREHIINPPFLPRIRTLVRNDFTQHRRLAFKLQSGDMRISDGAWLLKLVNGRTRLSYEALIAPKYAAPQFIISRAIAQDFPAMLRAIQRASAP